MAELPLLWAALAAYALFGVAVVRGRGSDGRLARPALAPALLAAALALHTAALGWRWSIVGHGPFTSLHEILSSNLWSLALVLALAWTLTGAMRAAWRFALPVLALLGLWLLASDAGPGHLPPTYATVLLWLHTLVGKLYLGLLLAATALGLAGHGPLAHRFAAYAFVFDTLMLTVGAVWAQDAWGRWWAWDPLESWAFASWLALAGALHARATLRPPARRFGGGLLAVFVLAFLTFFGVPFLSAVPHKGAL